MMRETEILEIAGQRFRQRREELHLSRAKVEAEARVSRRTIEFFEAGQRAPNFLRLARLCAAIGTTIEELMLFPPTDDGLGEDP